MMDAETTFVCPACWPAEAHTDHDRAVWKQLCGARRERTAPTYRPTLNTNLRPNQSLEFSLTFGGISLSTTTRSAPDVMANIAARPKVLAQFPQLYPATPSAAILDEARCVPYDARRNVVEGLSCRKCTGS